jgi:hypothetical protein
MPIFSGTQRLKLLVALVFVSLPALCFYAILWRSAVSIPILDDYDIILGALNWAAHNHGLPARLAYVFTNEHNGYKLMFENAVVFCQYSLLGQAHFLQLVALGNAFALLIFLTVVRMARVAPGGLATRCILLVPVTCLIFQLQYASALDFASSSLQHLAVISFSLLSICLLDRTSRAAFPIACIALVLAVASSPNGFFAGAAGLLMLLQGRHWRRICAWAATIAAMLLTYLYRYAPGVPVAQTGRPGLPNPIYALSFLGASAARYASVAPSLILGSLLCGVILLAVKRRYFRQNPAIFYSMIFIAINALAVSCLRSDLGLAQSLASRYRTYSNLMLAFSYLFMVETLLPRWEHKRIVRAAFAAALLCSVAFCGLSDLAGARFLQGKKQALTRCYRIEWQGLQLDEDRIHSGSDANSPLMRQIDAGVYDVKLPALREAVRNGVFSPPQNP